MKRIFTCLTALSLWVMPSEAQVVINEFMQSNIDCIMDDLNDFPDSWVELYNAGSAPVDMSEFSIGTSIKANKAYKLPKQTLNANDYVLVYCDKEEKSWHTSFRLESGKDCAIYLFRGSEIEDSIPSGLKKQPAPNIAYGRKTDASDEWGYMAVPTPKAANCGTTYSKILGNPVFSIPGMVYADKTKPLTLEISLPEGSPEGTVIRYTTDGKEPTEASKRYTAPISFSTTTVVRAKLFCDGYMSPRSTTHSYIMLGRKADLAVVSVVSDAKYFTDSKIGIFSDSKSFDGTENYKHNWRRPINYELFETNGEESKLNQLCEARVTGGASRGCALKSMGLYANKRFGEKRFNYEFFPDQRPGITDFKSVMMRNAGNDFDYLYMRDAVIQRIMSENVDIDWQAWRPAIFLLNGQYKGILNIRQRSNEDNIYTNYDGLEDLDMFENWWELKEGTWDNYNEFKAFYTEHGHTLAEYDKWMDTKEFLNLMLVNLYYNNRDFPGNNIVMWRPRSEDGRWRWIMKDTDFGLGLYGVSAGYNTIKWIYDPNYDKGTNWANQYDHTRLFRRLMEDADFKREFIDRAAIYMGDWLNERGTRAVWDPLYDAIKYEYPYHRELINKWWPKYDDELNNARNWIAQRTGYFYKYIAEYYGLGSPIPLTINTSADEAERSEMEITFNGVKLSEALFDGKFFKDRRVNLSGKSLREGYIVKGWKVTTKDNNSKETTETVDGSDYSFLMPSCKGISIEAIVGIDTGIHSVLSDNQPAEYYNLKGVKLNGKRHPDVIISRQGKSSRKILSR